jgi:hypothetical protein
VKAYNSGCICSLQLAFRLSTCARSTYPTSWPTTRISPSPCNARSLFMTTPRLHQKTRHFISRGCLVAIAGYCMTWSPLFVNWTRLIPIESDCYTLEVTTMPSRICGLVFVAPQVGVRFPDQIPVGYTARQRVDSKCTTIY